MARPSSYRRGFPWAGSWSFSNCMRPVLYQRWRADSPRLGLGFWQRRSLPMRPNRIPLLLVIGLLLWCAPGYAGDPVGPSAKAPVVRVLSPKGGAGTLFQPGSETKLLVTIEITDVSGAGLETDDFGTPKFYEPDDNVELFQGGIVAKGSYTNQMGQTVTQLTSVFAARELKISKDSKLSPPLDPSSITEDTKNGFTVPPEAMIDLAEFRFRVRDRNGAISVADAEGMRMWIGIAWQLHAPSRADALSDEEARKLQEQAATQRRETDEEAPKANSPPPDSN